MSKSKRELIDDIKFLIDNQYYWDTNSSDIYLMEFKKQLLEEIDSLKYVDDYV